MEIERQIPKDSNTLNTFQKKWSRRAPLNKSINHSYEPHLLCVEINDASVNLCVLCVNLE